MICEVFLSSRLLIQKAFRLKKLDAHEIAPTNEMDEF